MTKLPASFLVNKQTTCSSVAAQTFWNSGLGELLWQEVKNHAGKIGRKKVGYLQTQKSLIWDSIKLILNICTCYGCFERRLYICIHGLHTNACYICFSVHSCCFMIWDFLICILIPKFHMFWWQLKIYCSSVGVIVWHLEDLGADSFSTTNFVWCWQV